MIYFFSTILFLWLVALSWIDLKTFRLPNVLTFSLIGIGLLRAWWMTDLEAAFIGAILGYLVFVGIELGFRHLRGKDGLGRGDAKFLAAGGAWVGWMGLPFIVLIASSSALLALLFPGFRKLTENGRLPFGPFLALGIWLVWLANVFYPG